MKVQYCEYCLHTYEETPPEDVYINSLLFECKCTWQVLLGGDHLQSVKTMHYAYMTIMKIVICIMENGRLQNDFMRNLSSHHRAAEKVADDLRV